VLSERNQEDVRISFLPIRLENTLEIVRPIVIDAGDGVNGISDECVGESRG
jgi:hypothetical protein